MRCARIVCGLGVLIVLSACSRTESPRVTLHGPDGERVRVAVEIADDSDERQRGLMGRTTLPEGSGMLFVFDGAEVLTFWMKDTVIPLDILFFDAAGNFLSWASMVPCEEDPCPVYASSGHALTALEVPAGFVARHEVGSGWRIELPEEGGEGAAGGGQ